MKVFRLVRCGLLAAALPLVACDSQEAAEPPPEVATTTDSPAAEGTGPEEPGPDVEEHSVNLPGLPVGGGTDDVTAMKQCATAGWLPGNPIPDGVSIVVRKVRVEPEDAFAITGSSCGKFDGCASFVFTANSGSCSVPVKANGTDGNAKLSLFGEPVCAGGNARLCDDYAASLVGRAIPLTQPTGPTSTSSSEEPPEPQDDEPDEEPPTDVTMTDSTG